MSRFRHLKFYLQKHGAAGCCRIAFARLRTRIFGQREWLYVLDLAAIGRGQHSQDDLQSLSLASFTAAEQLDSDTLSGMLKFKSDYALQQFLSRWFSRGAILWVAKKKGHVVAVQWALEGGIGGFYSVPVLPGEVVIVAVEVFPAFRGQGLYPLMANSLNWHLQQAGFTRVYLKVAHDNLPMQRSLTKTPFLKIAGVYTRRCFGRSVTIWSMLSLSPANAPLPSPVRPV